MFEWHAYGHVPLVERLQQGPDLPRRHLGLVPHQLDRPRARRQPAGQLAQRLGALPDRPQLRQRDVGARRAPLELHARARRALRLAARRDARQPARDRDLRQRGHPADRDLFARDRGAARLRQAHSDAAAPVRRTRGRPCSRRARATCSAWRTPTSSSAGARSASPPSSRCAATLDLPAHAASAGGVLPLLPLPLERAAGRAAGRSVRAARAGATTTAVAASWNGATGVASWQVARRNDPQRRSRRSARRSPAPASRPRSTAATADPYVAVQALGKDGRVLATSAPEAVITPS